MTLTWEIFKAVANNADSAKKLDADHSQQINHFKEVFSNTGLYVIFRFVP